MYIHALRRRWERACSSTRLIAGRSILLLVAAPFALFSQNAGPADAPLTQRERMLLERVEQLENRLATLENKDQKRIAKPAENSVVPSATEPAPPSTQASSPTGGPAPEAGGPPASNPLAFADGTTLSFGLDAYYGYNFNHPIGRVNLFHAYDTTANNFTLGQANVIIERAPDLKVHRNLGYRFDLMFGQNSDANGGNPGNEPRPNIYRNVFQAYGSYAMPVGNGLQLDFGRFASSLGLEGTYAKDQLNYSRSFWFNYLPFYHTGMRLAYTINDKATAQYWLVNGIGQGEDFNGFKSQAAVLNLKPSSAITWNVLYYSGQEGRDLVPSLNPEIPLLPTQANFSTTAVFPRPNGRIHIVDTNASFNINKKWTVALEADYAISRVLNFSNPSLVYGGAGYLKHQFSDKFALAGRFEIMKDRNGQATGTRQDLKDATITATLQPVDGFQTRLEYRRDFSNAPFFLTNTQNVFARSQDLVTLGFLWWFGGKTGSW